VQLSHDNIPELRIILHDTLLAAENLTPPFMRALARQVCIPARGLRVLRFCGGLVCSGRFVSSAPGLTCYCSLPPLIMRAVARQVRVAPVNCLFPLVFVSVAKGAAWLPCCFACSVLTASAAAGPGEADATGVLICPCPGIGAHIDHSHVQDMSESWDTSSACRCRCRCCCCCRAGRRRRLWWRLTGGVHAGDGECDQQQQQQEQH
jgi:hypothetical protein